MDKISGYVIANSQGGYDVVTKTTQNSTAFAVPDPDEDITKAGSTSNTGNKNKNYDIVDYDPFQSVKTETVKLPEYMQTKTEPRRSDEEILSDLEALAKEHARTGKFQDSKDPRFCALRDEYLSSVSPDRAGILEKSTNEIHERLLSEFYPTLAELDKQKAKGKEDEKESIDYFMEMLKKGKKDKEIIETNMATRGMAAIAGAYSVTSIEQNGGYTTAELDYGGGKTTTLNYDSNGQLVSRTMKGNNYFVGGIDGNTVNNAFFYDDDGQLIMGYNGNSAKGLSQFHTKSEHTRLQEMLAVYNASYDFSAGQRRSYEVPQLSGATLTNVNGIVHTNVGKEAYDKTYDRLKSEMANSVA